MKARTWRFILPLLILGLAFGLRLYHLDFQSLWWDEGHSIFVASFPIPQIPTLPAMDVHPPAYFALLHGWMSLVGQSEFALRYLSVIFSLLTVALLWRFAAAISRRLTSPALAALFAAVSPLYVAYAQEVRSYAMITCLATAATFRLWQIILPAKKHTVSCRMKTLKVFETFRVWDTTEKSKNGVPRPVILAYIVLSAACLYTHYFTLFLLLFHNLAWLIWVLFYKQRRSCFKRDLLLWLGSQLGIVLLFIPQLFLAFRQVTGYTNPNLIPPSLSEFILRSWQAYTIGLTIDPTPAYWGMLAIAIVLGFTTCARKGIYDLRFTIYDWRLTIDDWRLTTCARKGIDDLRPTYPISSLKPHFFFLISWFLLPLAAYFAVLQRQPSFEPRYLILVTPALFLLLALGLGQRTPVTNSQLPNYKLQIINYASRITFYILCVISLAVFLFGLHSYYTNETYFKDDSAGVAAWLAAETTANDLIYVDVPHPFHYYADQGHIAAPLRYLFVDIHTAADTLTREAAGRDRLFWLTWRGSDTDPRGVIPFLAQKYGQLSGQRDFRGYHLEWYSLPKVKPIFSLPTDLPAIEATFGEVLRLDGAASGGYPPANKTVSPGHPAWVTLHFTLLRDTTVDYKVSVRLRGQNGQILAQVDKDLLNDRHFRPSAWPLEDPTLNQALNVYTLPLPANAPPGDYRLEVVVYNSQPPYPGEGVTGPARTADGSAAVIDHLKIIP